MLAPLSSLDRDVVVADRKTGTVCRIASSRDDQTPAIAPDGERSGVHLEPSWTSRPLAGVAGGGPHRKETTSPPHEFRERAPLPPSFPRMGVWVAFFRVVKGQRDIWAAPVVMRGPGAPRRRALFQDIHPAYAPDGRRLCLRFGPLRIRVSVWIIPLRAGLPAGQPWRLADGDADGNAPGLVPGREGESRFFGAKRPGLLT